MGNIRGSEARTCAKLVLQFPSFILSSGGYDDLRAFRHEDLGDSLTDAAGPACDNRNLVIKHSH